MKKYKYLWIFIVLVIVVWIYYLIDANGVKNNQSLKFNIPEKLVLKYASMDNWVIKDWENKILFSFLDYSTQIYTWSYLQLSNMLDLSEDNWKIFWNGKKIFTCSSIVCSYYNTLDSKYLVIVDKPVVNKWVLRKETAWNILKVLDLSNLEYREYPLLQFEWKSISLNSIEWYVK